MFNQSAEKKMHNLKVENFILFSKLVRDLNLGYRLVDSSERLFQRGSGGRSVYKALVKGSVIPLGTFFYRSLSVSHKDLMSP